MKKVAFLLFLGLSESLTVVNEVDKNRPVTKVINVLKDMQKQLEREAREDEDIYDKMACWCETNDKAKTKAISDAENKITSLVANIEEFTATEARLTTEIANLEKDIAQKQQSLQEATEIRQKELANFNEEEKDMLQSVGALKSALTVLSKHNVAKSALLDVKTIVRHSLYKKGGFRGFLLSPSQKNRLDSFLQNSKDYYDSGPIGEGSYASQSGEVYGILKQMLETFQNDLSESQKEEMQKQQAYADLKTSLEEEIQAAQDNRDSKENEKAKTVESLQISKEDLNDTRNSLSADQKYLMNLKQQCQMTDQEWEERQKTRADELKSISEALTILSSDDAHDVFTKTFNAEATTSFLQINNKKDEMKKRIAASKVISAISTKMGNKPELANLAVSVRLDAFTKVKKAIDDMVADLQTQQKDEVAKKDYCMGSFHENDKANEAKTSEREGLEADIAHLEGEIERLKNEIEGHQSNVKDLTEQIKRAGEDREKENMEFQRIIQEQTETMQILQKAITVLARVYQTDRQKAVQQTELVQQEPAGPPPPSGFETYQKKEGGGVIGLLNQIVADTKAMKKEAVVSEANAQKAYEQYVQDANDSKTAEQTALTNKSAEKADLNKSLEVDRTTLEEVENELIRISNEKADFHTQCDFLVKNFDARQEARSQEIEALKTAKSILSGSDFSELLQMKL